MSNEDVHSVLSAVEAFLKREQEVSGNLIYRAPHGIRRAADRPEPREDEMRASDPSGTIVAQGEADVAKQKKEATHAPASGVRSSSSSASGGSSAKAVKHTAASAGCDEKWKQADTLAKLNEYIRTCADCPLASTRTNFVFGVGPADARVMVIGEAPGADEDAQGEPFVGRAGQLLNKILESIHFKRDDVFIANILKCRPPNNRRPLPSEVEHCEPYLWKQIELVNPKLILCLGLTAAQTLLKTTASLGTLRESTQEYRGIPLVVTYHPAALLRNPNWKRPTWEDVKKFRKMYDELT